MFCRFICRGSKTLGILSLCVGLAILGTIFRADFCESDMDRPELPIGEWTWDQVAQEMTNLGYKCQWVDTATYPESYAQGMYLARNDDPRSWEEIVSRRPKAVKLWRGLVVICRNNFSALLEPLPEQICVGRFQFFGDPVEIDRIASHFGLAR